MTVDPKSLAVAFIKARNAEAAAQRNLNRATDELARRQKEAKSAEAALQELDKANQLRDRDVAVRDGDKLYLLNIMGHGVSVKIVPFTEIPAPKSYPVESAKESSNDHQ